MLRILLVGYGKMGRKIEQVALTRNHSIVGVVDPYVHEKSVQNVKLSDCTTDIADIAIDFSLPDSFLKNYTIYAERHIPVVVGTTGWYHSLAKVIDTFKQHDGRCVYGANFSVGAQLFLKMIAHATASVSPLNEYDLLLSETHHKQKIDSPSGTAKRAAEVILQNHRRKKRVVCEPLQRAIEEDELHLASLRGGTIPGVHTLTIDSSFDTITITHNARTREGFALGAVLAAEWMSQNSGVHNIEDIIEEVLHK